MKTMTIYKYPVPIADRPVINLPIGAKVLSFGVQNDQLFIWALVDTAQQSIPRQFYLVVTGREVGRHVLMARFVGTAMIINGSFVAHLFEP